MIMSSSVDPWNSLEIVKLFVSSLTPIAVVWFGFYINRISKRLEQAQWANQKVIEKRISIYDIVAPKLNDLFCYFAYVGNWKDLTPVEVIKTKRDLDKQVFVYSPLFPRHVFDAYQEFINLCFQPYSGWGHNARLRTDFSQRQEAFADKWEGQWESCFSEKAIIDASVRTLALPISTLRTA